MNILPVARSLPAMHFMMALAERIAKEVIASFPVAEVTVRVRKPHPPVGMLVGSAQVEITRGTGECCK